MLAGVAVLLAGRVVRADETSPPAPEDTLRWFFAKVRDGQIAHAYQATDAAFRASTSAEQLAAFLRVLDLTRVAGSAWVESSRDVRHARLDGAAVTDTGRAIPLATMLSWDGRIWRIAYLALNEPPDLPGLPPLTRQQEWVQTTFRALGRALASGDYTGLYRHLATPAQLETSPVALAEAFASLRATPVDVLALVDAQPPVLTASVTRGPGEIEVSGFYDSPPLRMLFQIAYRAEGDAWRPLALKVEPVASPTKQ